MLKRYQTEIDGLNWGPDHPILLQSFNIFALKPFFWAGTFKIGHAAQEESQVTRCKNGLICEYSSNGCDLWIGESNLGQQLVPLGSSRSKYHYSKINYDIKITLNESYSLHILSSYQYVHNCAYQYRSSPPTAVPLHLLFQIETSMISFTSNSR
jgi:hypothetical protein